MITYVSNIGRLVKAFHPGSEINNLLLSDWTMTVRENIHGMSVTSRKPIKIYQICRYFCLLVIIST